MDPDDSASETALKALYPFRESQVEILSHLFSPNAPAPPAIVVHGPEATGKSSLIKAVLAHTEVPHLVVDSDECITGRHLFERALSGCVRQADTALDASASRTISTTRCENVNALALQLQPLLRRYDKFVLVFDSIDGARELPATALSAFVRLQETVPQITVVLVLRLPSSVERTFSTAGIPYVFFPPYEKQEACQILAVSTPRNVSNTPLLANSKPRSSNAEDANWLWQAFCESVWDTLGQNAANDLVSFRRLAEKLWQPFIASVQQKTNTPIRDFARHWLSNRSLFTNEDALVDRLVPTAPLSAVNGDILASMAQHNSIKQTAVDAPLPHFQEYLVCAAYLASNIPPRRDHQIFTRYHEKKPKRRGGAVKGLRGTKHHQIARRLLKPSSFPLERLLAIFHAIFPIDHVKPSADMYTQIASLSALRLIVRSGVGANDVLDPGTKWRVNVGWDHAVAVGRRVGFDISEYISD